MEQVTVDAALEVTLRGTKETHTLLGGDLEVSVEGAVVADSEYMDGLIEQLRQVVVKQYPTEPLNWVLLVAYEGRCWYIEPGDEGVDGIGYYDVTTVEGWKQLNGCG